jgi:hypothetical protein
MLNLEKVWNSEWTLSRLSRLSRLSLKFACLWVAGLASWMSWS